MLVIIYGEPFGKQRPRFSRQGGYVKTYTPAKTTSYEEHVKQSFISQGGLDHRIAEGMVGAKITAYYSIPKSTSKKKREQMLEDEIRPTKKPDTDNIAKIVLDSLNKLAYDDDKQVVELIVQKRYALVPRVEIELWEVRL